MLRVHTLLDDGDSPKGPGQGDSHRKKIDTPVEMPYVSTCTWSRIPKPSYDVV